jgi:hypothetical protein
VPQSQQPTGGNEGDEELLIDTPSDDTKFTINYNFFQLESVLSLLNKFNRNAKNDTLKLR